MSWWDDVVSAGETLFNTASTIYSYSLPGVAVGLVGDLVSGKTYTYGDHLEIGKNGLTTETALGGNNLIAQNPITQSLTEEHTAAQAAADAAAQQAAANKAYIEASWESAIDAAGTTYDRMLADATEAEKQNESNFQSNISAMKNQFGYTDGSGNNILGEQSQQVVTLKNNIAAATSKRLAVAGDSGVKMSGSVKASDSAANQAAADAINVATASEKYQAKNAVTQTGQSYTSQKTAISRQREDAATLKKNWGGSFDWTTFSNQGTSDNQSLLYKQYASQLASNNAGATASAYNYVNALKESDPYNLWNYSQYASGLLNLGMGIAGLVG